MRKSILVLLAVLVFAFPVFAQDAEITDVPEPTPTEVAPVDPPADVEPVPNWFDIEYVAKIVIGAVGAVVLGAFGTSPITTFVVSLTKRLPFLKGVSAPTQVFLVSAVPWTLTVVFGVVGFGAQWAGILDAVADIAPGILGLITTLIGAPALHEAAAKRGVAVIGYKRSVVVADHG